MPRKKYNEYDYIDPDNEYTYKGNSVLRNKFNITDVNEAKIKEYSIATEKLVQLGFIPIEVKSIEEILKIHKYIFDNMYDWAGQFRKVNISKEGNAFMSIQSFDTGIEYLNSLIDKFHNTANSTNEISKQLADILDNLNYFHPFREGNGRTQREVVRSLALSKGYYADIDISIDDTIYHLYMDGTVYGDVDKLTKLFELVLGEMEYD